MKTKAWIMMTVAGLASASALAQYTGPSASKGVVAKTTPAAVAPTTVKALTTTGKDDTRVSLQGRIVQHLGGERYRFADSTGEIELEIDKEHWPANTPIDDKAEVKVTGEYDKDLVSKPKIEVDRIEKIK